MKWFKHDSDASLDAKLKKVRMKYGMEGYGLYWYCLELIAQTVEKHNLTFELEHDAELIAMDTSIHQERVQEMMLDFVKWGLFENTDGAITCLKMATRTDEYTQKLIRSQGLLLTMSRQTPDSVPPKSDLIEENRREEKRREKDPMSKPAVSPCQHKKIIELYHAKLPELPKVLASRWKGSERETALKARWREDEKHRDLQFWEWFFSTVRTNPHWMGNNQRGWQADLGWLLKRTNFDKVIQKGVNNG